MSAKNFVNFEDVKIGVDLSDIRRNDHIESVIDTIETVHLDASKIEHRRFRMIEHRVSLEDDLSQIMT